MSNRFIDLENGNELYTGYFSPELCEAYSNKLWVFGDNEQRKGRGGQAVIRECNNAFGIATKATPGHSDSDYWSDDNYEHNCSVIDSDLEELKNLKAWTKQSVVFSIHGYGTGLAELSLRAPKTFSYLIQKLNEFCEKQVFSELGTSYIS